MGGSRWTAVTHTFPSFDDAKQVFSPLPDASNPEEQADHTSDLSLKKFLSFWCFDLCYVLGLKGVFVTAETEVGYGDWQKHTSSGLTDTFQTTGR